MDDAAGVAGKKGGAAPRRVPRLPPGYLPQGKGQGAQSVERALDLLSRIGRGGPQGLGIADLVAATGLSRPTARRLLLALIAARLVEQDATHRYHPGPEAFLLGALSTPRHGMLVHAGDALTRLAADTGDTLFLSVPQGDHVLCLHREEGGFPVRTHALKAGDRNPMGVGGAGLALLAALPEDEAAAMLDRLAPVLAARFDRPGAEVAAELAGDVAEARGRGWALNPGRVVAGSWGIGVAVRWPGGQPAAALSLAAIDSRLQPDRAARLARLLAAEAAVIEDRLARHFKGGGHD